MEARGIDRLDLVITDWFIFSNVTWIGEMRSPSGNWSTSEVSTATILLISEDGRFRAILGYGTSPDPV
jgi:hypothetical protein